MRIIILLLNRQRKKRLLGERPNKPHWMLFSTTFP